MAESRKIQITTCSAEGTADCGELSRVELVLDNTFAERLGELLKGAPAWSPIVWKNNERRATSFERADLVALDWELPGKPEFPRDRYEDPERLRAFIESLRAPVVPLPDFAHMTTHGLRLIFVLSRAVTEPEEYRTFAQRLCLDYGADLQATDLARVFAAARHLQRSKLLEITTNG